MRYVRGPPLWALDIYAEKDLDFEDTLLVAYTEQTQTRQLYSYDAGIDSVQSVVRREPEMKD